MRKILTLHWKGEKLLFRYQMPHDWKICLQAGCLMPAGAYIYTGKGGAISANMDLSPCGKAVTQGRSVGSRDTSKELLTLSGNLSFVGIVSGSSVRHYLRLSQSQQKSYAGTQTWSCPIWSQRWLNCMAQKLFPSSLLLRNQADRPGPTGDELRDTIVAVPGLRGRRDPKRV